MSILLTDLVARAEAEQEKARIKSLRGEKGKDGIDGKDGLSIRGEKGDKGDTGLSIKGDKGDCGERGERGPAGLSIKGDKGDKGDPGKDAIQIQDINVSPVYDLLVKMENGKVINAGKLPKGEPGRDGRGSGGGGTSRKYVDTEIAAAITASNITLSGENYLSLTGQALTANPVNLSGTNVTSTLPETKGGTGQSTYAIGDTLYSSATNTLSKLSGNTTTTQKFLSQTGDGVNSAAPAWSDVQDADVVFTDVTTNNTTATKHGYAPKLSNSATQFLNGEGNWTTPSGIANAYVAQAFSAVTTVTVTHNFGAYPVIQIIDNTGAVIVPLTITNSSINAFTVTFTSSKTGTVLATVGSPQLAAYTTVTDNYTLLSGDYFVECTAAGKTMTLPTAVGRQGQRYSIDNSSNGDIDITTTGGQTIHGYSTITIPESAVVTVVSNGSNWRIN